MAILAECPRCHKKQTTKNRACDCGADLVKEKRLQKVRYWITYRLPNGKQRKEFVGNLITDAQAADGKRKAQKKENPGVLEMVSAERMTFAELIRWYLNLSSVKKERTFDRVEDCLKNFNQVFGDRIVSSLKPLDLEHYQDRREMAGRAAATIDMELVYAKAMVKKAFANDLVDGRTLKAFLYIKKKLRRGANARKRPLTLEEHLKLLAVAPDHLVAFLTVAMNTGMRLGELLRLQWSHIDREKWVIRLPADLTKEKMPKVIPINHHVKRVLANLPRAIHHDFVLLYKDKPIVTLKTAFKKACAKAGIPYGRKIPNGIVFHDTRGTVKTNMLNAGVDPVYRNLILGHSLKGVDIHYMAPTEDDLHRAMSKYTDWLDAQMKDVAHIVAQPHINA